MRKYDKGFKEEAEKLSNEMGLKQAAAQLGVALLHAVGMTSETQIIWRSRLCLTATFTAMRRRTRCWLRST
jgi:hypothetical protein